MKVLVVNPGTLHVFQLARGLARNGLLHQCATSLYISERQLSLLPGKDTTPCSRHSIRRRVANRMCPELEGKVIQFPLPEILYLASRRFGIGNKEAWLRWRNRVFGHWVAKNLLDDVDVVWSFDTASVEIFREAKRRGIARILDMSIAHPAAGQAVMAKYVEAKPQYTQHEDEVRKSHEELLRRQEETELADTIVAASTFTAGTLNHFGVNPAKVRVFPYGVDLDLFRPRSQVDSNRKIVFLFVGWFSFRKGVYDLLEAWEKARLGSDCELWMAGGDQNHLSGWKGPLPSGVRLLGRLPHADLASIYQKANVFIFPSLFEGFGLVLLEAMASGLPILTTYNTAGPDLADEGVEGFFFEAGNVDALVNLIKNLATSPKQTKTMGIAARRRAEMYTWEAYENCCAEIVRIFTKTGYIAKT